MQILDYNVNFCIRTFFFLQNAFSRWHPAKERPPFSEIFYWNRNRSQFDSLTWFDDWRFHWPFDTGSIKSKKKDKSSPLTSME